jgi:hypothetical protein
MKRTATDKSRMPASGAVRFREEASRHEKAGAAWFRMSVAICMKVGSESNSQNLGHEKGGLPVDRTSCTAIQVEDDTVAELAPEHCNSSSKHSTMIVRNGSEPGLVCEEKAESHQNNSPHPQAASALSTSPILRLGESFNTRKFTVGPGEIEAALHCPSPVANSSACDGMNISLFNEKNDIALVLPPSNCRNQPFVSCIYKSKGSLVPAAERTDSHLKVHAHSKDSEELSGTKQAGFRFQSTETVESI